MNDTRSTAPLEEQGLLDATGKLQSAVPMEVRELRSTIVEEFLAADNADERAILLEIHETLMDNLRRSAVPGAHARLRAEQAFDRHRMGLKPAWSWITNWRRRLRYRR